MEKRTYSSAEEALAIAKEALWLAWNAAGGPSGMGAFQNNPGADKEAVWAQAYNMGDYTGKHGGNPERINADYVFGRMLKLRFEISGASLEIPDHEPRWDYQGWSGPKYPTYAALFDEAEAEVKQRAA
ncbi:MAG: hypothetical protein WC655_24850 [Candidatus Hydrogenedentales bacterium]|jgi:hypothetical protein